MAGRGFTSTAIVEGGSGDAPNTATLIASLNAKVESLHDKLETEDQVGQLKAGVETQPADLTRIKKLKAGFKKLGARNRKLEARIKKLEGDL
jgi:cell division protein FtsB